MSCSQRDRTSLKGWVHLPQARILIEQELFTPTIHAARCEAFLQRKKSLKCMCLLQYDVLEVLGSGGARETESNAVVLSEIDKNLKKEEVMQLYK